MKFTKAKTVAAAIGSAVTVVVAVFADNVLDVGEAGDLVAALITAGATIYAVYKTKNKPTQ